MVMHCDDTELNEISASSFKSEGGVMPGARRLGRGLVLVSAVAALVLVAGCREEEQDRILFYDKGVYLGPEDTPLTEDGFQALRERAQAQHF